MFPPKCRGELREDSSLAVSVSLDHCGGDLPLKTHPPPLPDVHRDEVRGVREGRPPVPNPALAPTEIDQPHCSDY